MTRLDLIASYTKGSKVVCDIGCDHAYALIDSVKIIGIEWNTSFQWNFRILLEMRLNYVNWIKSRK